MTSGALVASPRVSSLRIAPESKRSFYLACVFVGVVVLTAIPAFLFRLTGVMDDSVFWVVAKSVNSGEVLYRDIFFTQPPLFIWIPQTVWLLTDNIFIQRGFLIAVWLLNGLLFYLALQRLDRNLSLMATGLFMVSAFIDQSYALHTEIFVLTVFLIGVLAIERGFPAAEFVVGLTASTALLLKPIGPLVFIPCTYYFLAMHPNRLARRVLLLVLGALLPAAVVAAYLVSQGGVIDFWNQVVLDNGNVGLSVSADWRGYVTLVVAPLLAPLFVGLVLADRRPQQLEWWLAIGVFTSLLAIEVLRGARHYGLFNLCILAWMAVRAQDNLARRNSAQSIGLAALVALAAVFQLATIREILNRGLVTDELTAAQFARSLPHGSLQVFGNDPPRIYMLLNSLMPASAYLFVYDTNRDLVRWDSYLTWMDQSPPDYIAVEDNFAAVEYGRLKSTQLTDATAVRTWIEQQGSYQRLEVGRPLGLTLYQRLQANAQGGT